MNIKGFFLLINIFICLYNDILNQNLSLSKIAIYHPPHPSWTTKKSISQNSLVKYSPICHECVNKKIYVNEVKLKWQKYLKQKIYRTERKSIKLRQEAKKPVSWHHDGDPFKDINYIFSLRVAFYGMHQFYLSH